MALNLIELQREHNEAMLKLEFARDLSGSLIELARSRSSPLSESVIDDNTATTVFVNQRQRNVEQLLLYVRAMELLASGLNVARTGLSTGQLRSSTQTRQGMIILL